MFWLNHCRLVVDHQVQFPQVRTGGHYQVNVILDLLPLQFMNSGLVTHSLGTSVTEPHHFLSNISKLGSFRHKSNVRLTKIVSITAVAQFLELEVLVITVPWQVLKIINN